MMVNMASPLVNIARAAIKDAILNLSEKELEEATHILEGYINGQVNYAIIAQVFMAKYGNTSPVDKIRDILTVKEEPLPTRPQYAHDVGLRKKTQQWTHIEDMRLLAGLHRFGMENWTLVAQFVGNGRSRSQCSQRWLRGLDPRISRNHWTREEEEKLLKLVEKLGDKSWIRVASEMGNRSDVQCRYRYLQIQKEAKTDVKSVVAPEPAQQSIANSSSSMCQQDPLSFDDAMQLDFDDTGGLFANVERYLTE